MDKVVSTQTENFSEECIPTKETDSCRENQEIKNMEVHHHSHSSHGKKTWKGYFWEFLMLFLAVFCGFLAEYKLEHVIEHQREKKYMKLMVEDLKEDTSEIMSCKERIGKTLIPAHERSTLLLFQSHNVDSILKELYTDVPQSLLSLSLSFQDVTSTQLKNSGNLRLIENTEVSTQLSAYWNKCTLMKATLLNGYEKTRNDSKDLFFSAFNLSNYENNSPFSPLRHNAPCKLLTDNKDLIRLGNNISNLQSQLEGPFDRNLSELYTQASNLIKLIKTEYQINN